jgi:hypothetical protein
MTGESGQLISLREHTHQKSEIFFCRCSRHLQINVRQGIAADPFRPSEPMEAQMSNSQRFANIAECSAQIRFVLVNGREPRSDTTCALCSLIIKNEYVRAPQTGLIYCDAQCFAEHEKMTALTLKKNVRKVS